MVHTIADRQREGLDAIDELLRGAGHELKTPLTALKLGLDSVTMQLSSGDLDTEMLALKVAACQRQVTRLTALVATLLDFSRAQTGRLSVRRETFDLTQVVHQAALRLAEDARRAGCELSVIASDPAVGCWDRERLSRVVTGLVLNAFKFGTGQPVEVGVRCDDDKARVWVRDHGKGLAPEAARQVFDRVAPPAGQTAGLRLTLFVAKHIVEALDGQLSVESIEGAGATFIIELPLATR